MLYAFTCLTSTSFFVDIHAKGLLHSGQVSQECKRHSNRRKAMRNTRWQYQEKRGAECVYLWMKRMKRMIFLMIYTREITISKSNGSKKAKKNKK